MSIELRVDDDWIHNANCSMTPETFKELTGTKIDLTKRIGKDIYVVREKGHLYFYDRQFIIGAKYQHNGKIYKCEHLTKTGAAVFSRVGKNLEVIHSTEPLAFRIIE